jgi:murein DD-endopeptidase MepM/ murein hydrolase activator NlpD
MYKGKRILKDKSIIIMSVVSVMALSGLAAAIMISDNKSSGNITQIAALEDETSSSDSKDNSDLTENSNSTNDSSLVADTGTTKKTDSTKNTDPTSDSNSAANNDSATDTTDSTDTDSSDEAISDDEDASVNAPASALSFTNSSILVWPVETCDIIIDYSMDTTTYFATLDMYKTSDAVCIRSEIGSPVYACADGIVTLNSYNEELGHFIAMDLGNQYELTYGQLKDIQIDEGDTLKKGDLIGYINEPTKYYTVEGANLYLKLTENGTPVDPLDYLDYDKP